MSSGLRAPGPLRTFTRHEIKYLVEVAALPRLRDELSRWLDRDQHGGDGDDRGAYAVWSIYYDTVALRFYWEKVKGIRFRRKLRIRHYGNPRAVANDSPVFVEIKQRVNRVTQKRRTQLPYGAARLLCEGRGMVAHEAADQPFVAEVLDLVSGLDLRPVTITGYQREAFFGGDGADGLRVTIDQGIRGRDRDLDLAAAAENRFIVAPHRAIVEVKATARVPSWLADLTARQNLSVVRVSKYCQSVEAFGRAPRSAFHV